MSLTSGRILSRVVYAGLRHERLRRLLTHFIPDVTETAELFSRPLCFNRRREIGYWRAVRHQRANIVFHDEVPALLSVLTLLRPNSTFVDCGANVGLFSAAVAPMTRIYPQFRLYAIEPNPDTFARLSITLAGVRAELLNVALSDHSGFLSFSEGVTSGVFTAQDSGSRQSRLHQIPCRRLDQIGIVGAELVLKIDVEGHEWEVLAGAEGLFRQGRIAAIFLDGATRERDIVEFLETQGFALLDARSLGPYETRHGRIIALRNERQ
jgi:FkbM family methyltransferase